MHDHMKKVRRGLRLATALLLMGALTGPAWAVDGVIEINQARALKGGVTPGDEPGFPVTITQPGSYRLMGNLTVPDTNTTAILITTGNVTVDLNGFAIIGPGGGVANGSGITHSGLSSDPRPTNVTVINGTVQGMGSGGIFLLGNLARVVNVRAISNGQAGIRVGDESTVVGSTAHDNGGLGIQTGSRCTVQGNTVNNSRAAGFLSGAGLVVGFGCTASGNTVANNASVGLSLQSGSGYTSNVLTGNNGGGAQVSGGIQIGPNVCGDALCP